MINRYEDYIRSKLPILAVAPEGKKKSFKSWGNPDEMGGVIAAAVIDGEPCSSADALRELQTRDGFSRCSQMLFPTDWEADDAEVATKHITTELLPAGCSVRLQAYPKPLAASLMDSLESSGYTMDPVGFTMIVVAFRPQPDMPLRYGVYEKDPLWETLRVCGDSQEGGGQTAWNRARHKMIESIQILQAHPRGCNRIGEAPAAGEGTTKAKAALDIGAAPGGWTHSLALLDGLSEVIAVDPADLHIDVSGHPKVRHIQSMIQDAIPELALSHPAGFSLVSCDANNQHCEEMASVVGQGASLIAPQAPLVFTFKLQKRCSPELLNKIDTACRSLLGPWFEGFELHWLFGNSANERTLFAWRNTAEAVHSLEPIQNPLPMPHRGKTMPGGDQHEEPKAGADQPPNSEASGAGACVVS